jgi:hypothetical protein
MFPLWIEILSSNVRPLVSRKDDGMTESCDRLPRRDLDQALGDRAIDDDGKIFVDFDHTIFSCNSTELFIASCKPSFMAAAIDFVVRDCIPWRLTGLPRWFRLRDYVCCALLFLLMPWTLLMWRRNAPALFARHESQEVRSNLETLSAGQIVIVTFGMGFIVRCLLRGSRWEGTPLVATPLLAGRRHFARGKLLLLEDHFGRAEIAASTAISDSPDDLDLLLACRHGILIQPQGEEFRTAEHLYFPLRYTIRAKYGLLHMVDKVILVDLLLLLLSTSRDLDDILRHLLCLPFLVLSMMCIYEIGYFENDMVAAKSEAKPTLTSAVQRFRAYPIQPGAWLWGIGLGILGCLAAVATRSMPFSALATGIVSWVISLVMLRVVFFIYNQQETRSRILIYPVLQLMKYLPVFLLIHPTVLGVILATSQVAMMSVVYTAYRLGGDTKPLNKEAFRTILWVIGACLLATIGRFSIIGSLLPVSLMLLWCLARLGKARILDRARRTRGMAMHSAD